MLSLIYFFPVFGVCDKQDRAPVVFRLRMFINRIASRCFSCSCPIASVFFNSRTILDLYNFGYVQAASCNRQYRSKFTTACSVYLQKKAIFESWIRG